MNNFTIIVIIVAGILKDIITTILILCVLSWLLCDIDQNKEYTWYSGIWHGIFFLGNFARSWFSDALYKAETYTTAYNVLYWIFSIWTTFGVIFGGHNYNRS